MIEIVSFYFSTLISSVSNIFRRKIIPMMASIIANDESKRENDEDNITKRLNKAFESRLDLDRVSGTLIQCIYVLN